MLFTTTKADAYNHTQAIADIQSAWHIVYMDPLLPETIEESDVSTYHDIREPSLYKVLLHNDDYTTMEFVVYVLMEVFHKSVEDATRIMLNVHKQGIGVCGLYTCEIAETKVETVTRMARENGHPLKCTMEKA
jgi:ATP-dependent Clp protease adaptor protein ClpS